MSKLARGERVAPSRVTLAEIAKEWIEAQKTKPRPLRPGTIERYETVLRLHVLPRLGTLETYTHLFDHAAHAEKARKALEEGFANIL